MRWTVNERVLRSASYPAALRPIIGLDAHRAARSEIETWPGYRPTPLREASVLSAELGVGQIWIKDEAHRFGLGSFKALGGAYGVLQVLRRHPDASAVTVTTASDGNHGRSVAWGADLFGCEAVIYLPTHVTEARAHAIRAFGARVVRVDGEYDDAVATADADAEANGWTVVSDTSYEGYDQIPRWVMQGYTVMMEEALEALAETLPTHVFVQGGVGGLAAAVVGHCWERLGAARPITTVVEPECADGLFLSALAGAPSASSGDLHTLMAGLSCREVSPIAWRVLEPGVAAFATIGEDGIEPLMRAAATGALGDRFEGGESGVAGLQGLIEVARDPGRRADIGLSSTSRVLVFNTEGATDPELYAAIVAGPS